MHRASNFAKNPVFEASAGKQRMVPAAVQKRGGQAQSIVPIKEKVVASRTVAGVPAALGKPPSRNGRDPLLVGLEHFLLKKLKQTDVIRTENPWLFNVIQAAYAIEMDKPQSSTSLACPTAREFAVCVRAFDIYTHIHKCIHTYARFAKPIIVAASRACSTVCVCLCACACVLSIRMFALGCNMYVCMYVCM